MLIWLKEHRSSNDDDQLRTFCQHCNQEMNANRLSFDDVVMNRLHCRKTFLYWNRHKWPTQGKFEMHKYQTDYMNDERSFINL